MIGITLNKERELKKTIIVFFIIMVLFVTIYRCFNVEEKILLHLYPIKYQEIVYKYSEELEIDPMLTLAIIKTESNFEENCVSRSGAIGLMQLMETTAKEQAEKIKLEYYDGILYNPEQYIKIGLYYFHSLLDYFNNNYILAAVAYNAGIGNTEKWIEDGIITDEGIGIENIPFKETNIYVRKIIRNYTIYKELYS